MRSVGQNFSGPPLTSSPMGPTTSMNSYQNMNVPKRISDYEDEIICRNLEPERHESGHQKPEWTTYFDTSGATRVDVYYFDHGNAT